MRDHARKDVRLVRLARRRKERLTMTAQVQAASLEAVERLHHAMNQHDLEAFLACFDPNYRSEQPAHPSRGFGGREQVEKNWSAMFEGMPDFHAELLADATSVMSSRTSSSGIRRPARYTEANLPGGAVTPNRLNK